MHTSMSFLLAWNCLKFHFKSPRNSRKYYSSLFLWGLNVVWSFFGTRIVLRQKTSNWVSKIVKGVVVQQILLVFVCHTHLSKNKELCSKVHAALTFNLIYLSIYSSILFFDISMKLRWIFDEKCYVFFNSVSSFFGFDVLKIDVFFSSMHCTILSFFPNNQCHVINLKSQNSKSYSRIVAMSVPNEIWKSKNKIACTHKKTIYLSYSPRPFILTRTLSRINFILDNVRVRMKGLGLYY